MQLFLSTSGLPNIDQELLMTLILQFARPSPNHISWHCIKQCFVNSASFCESVPFRLLLVFSCLLGRNTVFIVSCCDWSCLKYSNFSKNNACLLKIWHCFHALWVMNTKFLFKHNGIQPNHNQCFATESSWFGYFTYCTGMIPIASRVRWAFFTSCL